MPRVFLIIVLVAAGSISLANEETQYSERSSWDREGWNASPIIREACSGIDRWALCGAAAESAFLFLHPTITHQSGVLRIPLANGKELSFKDSQDTGGYRYLGMISPLPFHLVLFAYEETSYAMINSKTGWSISIDAFPVVSPNNKFIATAIPDWRGDRPNAIQILSVVGDTLRLDYLLDAWKAAHPDTNISAWAPKHATWLGNDSLRCDVSFLRKDQSLGDHYVFVVRSSDEWEPHFEDQSNR
jgi:hypothetical protein